MSQIQNVKEKLILGSFIMCLPVSWTTNAENLASIILKHNTFTSCPEFLELFIMNRIFSVLSRNNHHRQHNLPWLQDCQLTTQSLWMMFTCCAVVAHDVIWANSSKNQIKLLIIFEIVSQAHNLIYFIEPMMMLLNEELFGEAYEQKIDLNR